jgi:hypothetical protein
MKYLDRLMTDPTLWLLLFGLAVIGAFFYVVLISITF